MRLIIDCDFGGKWVDVLSQFLLFLLPLGLFSHPLLLALFPLVLLQAHLLEAILIRFYFWSKTFLSLRLSLPTAI